MHSAPPSGQSRPAAQPHDPMEVMGREMRLQAGQVPDSIAGVVVEQGCQWLKGPEFLLREQGFAVYYRQGQGLTTELADEAARPRMELFLSGSVYAAVACINGLYPLHASAVVQAGQVIAFTGPSGAGKSTLVAALNARGLPLFADDTLVMDMAASPPLCLPGHKRLKLWPDAVALAGACPLELVSPDYPKHYVRSTGSDMAEIMPLGGIVTLAQGGALDFEQLHGGARLTALDETHYTEQLCRMARAEDAAATFTRRAALAQAVPHYRFTRPFAPEAFGKALDFLMERLTQTWP